MRFPLLISASKCQDAPMISLYPATWKFVCDDETANFQVQIYDETRQPIIKQRGDMFGCTDSFSVKVISLTTNKPCSIYAELVRATAGSS